MLFRKIAKILFRTATYIFAIIGVWSLLVTNQSGIPKNKSLATPQNPVISPSGEYQLMISEGFNGFYEYAHFSIAKNRHNTHGDFRIVFSSEEMFRLIGDLRFLWDEKNNVWVYSSDIGTFYYAKVSDEQWDKHPFEGDVNSCEVPDEIREVILDHE